MPKEGHTPAVPMVNLKGGVAETTNAVALAGCFSAEGLRTPVIDADRRCMAGELPLAEARTGIDSERTLGLPCPGHTPQWSRRMDADSFPELAAARTLLESAGLPGEAREAALWCLGQMTRPYRELLRTQEHRYHDAVQGLALAMLKHLRDQGGAGVADAFVAHMHALHERLGLPPLSLKPASPVGRRPRKAA